MLGWRVQGQAPEGQSKAIFIAAPHTTNWDGVVMVLVALAMGLRLSWLGKKSLLQGPKRYLMKFAGAVPVDRSGGLNTVQQVARTFNETERLYLAVAPAGTRKKTDCWKTGFYHMAVEANVPIFCGFLDYSKGEGGIRAVVNPTGDIEADLERFKEIYADVRGGIPSNESRIALRAEIEEPEQAEDQPS
jgi:1-acyl-sn-glycerol-3-phosphate acyltransferase